MTTKKKMKFYGQSSLFYNKWIILFLIVITIAFSVISIFTDEFECIGVAFS